MSHQLCEIKRSGYHSSNLTSKVLMNRSTSRLAGNALVEQTRQFMERSIKFVSQPSYAASNAVEVIQTRRPSSLNHPCEISEVRHGGTFITDLVSKQPLTREEEQYWFDLLNFLKHRAEQSRLSLDPRRLDVCLVNKIRENLNAALVIRNHIVESNLRLVVAVAKQFSRLPGQIYELISEGMPPLIRFELFDVGSGNHFSTYATCSVRNQIQRFLKRGKLYSVWFPCNKFDSFETIPDTRIDGPDDEMETQKEVQFLHRILSSLSDRERHVILARFGLDDQGPRPSLASIGAQVGLSGERVRQLIA